MQYRFIQITGYAVLMLALLLLSGCADVKLVADYDKEVLADTFALAKRVDLFWANYLGATGEGRRYPAVKEEMIGIEVELNGLLLKNEARDKNKQTTMQVKNVIDIWARSSGLIKSQGSVSNSSATAYRRQMADAFKYIVTGEEAKNISDNNTSGGGVQ